MTEMPKTIATRLVKAQAAVGPAEKNSRNEHHKYAYASAEEMVTIGKRALASAGLALIQTGWRIDRPAMREVPDGKYLDLDRLVVSYLLCSDEGESWEMPEHSTPVIVEKGRPEDKAEATALTYSLSYSIRGLLSIPRVDEGTDVDQRNDNNRERQTPARQASRPGPKMNAADPITVATAMVAKIDGFARAEDVAAYEEWLKQNGPPLPNALVAKVNDALSRAWKRTEAAA